ncbi:MAG: hypothetical protein NXI22_17880, partial [bacterium]|nr:hypothetical protein [bacterium]
MRRLVTAATMCTFAWLLFAVPFLSAEEPTVLRSKQMAQEKARSLARELLSGVLDIQLRQLRENGMQGLPIYRDIESMRANIDDIAGEEMREVVELLVRAQEGEPEQRLAAFTEARGKIRGVVLSLMAERQKLYKRLQIARLAAQIRRLIDSETEARDVTAGLPALPQLTRENTALSVIEDQRDVHSYFLQLVETLADVSTWGGPAGAGAGDGLRILKAAQVGEELDQAAK